MALDIYRDVDQSLKRTYVTNVDSIKQAIRNILTTRKGTRLFNSEFGSDIHKYLFDHMDSVTEFNILSEVVKAINLWEPRVTVNFGSCKVVSDKINKIYWITIVFFIKAYPTEVHNYEIGIRHESK